MEATVRCIPTDIAVVDGQTFNTGNKPALCFRGKTYALGIVNEQDSISTVTLTLRDHDTAPLVRYGTESEYPVGRFISHMERIMQTKPISDEALELIRQWPNNPEDFGDPVISDEEEPERPKPMLKKKNKTNCIAVIATEMGLAATKIRKFLRSQGFKAPYDNETKIRQALKQYKG